MSKTGTVKFFNDDKGFGFIVQDNGGEDLFAHRNNLADAQNLVEGDNVRYDEAWDDIKGKSMAQNITGGTGGSIGGFNGGGFGGGKGGGFGGGKGGSRQPEPNAVFVNGFDFDTSECAIAQHFETIGRVLGVQPVGRGGAVVRFDDMATATLAVREMNETTIAGNSRYITVKLDGEKGSKSGGKSFGGGFSGGFGGGGGYGGGKSSGGGKGKGNSGPAIYVGGLSFDTTSDGLRDHFACFGEITYAAVMSDKMTGRSRGCGKVAFASEQAMDYAISQFNQTEFDGRTISVRAFT